MAQRVTGINVRRRRATTKKQREEAAKIEIQKLTGQLDVLRGRLTEVTEQREAMTLPNLEGKKVEHSKYGEGCVTVDDSEATERCRRINDLETEQSKLKKEIQYRESWISDLQKQG